MVGVGKERIAALAALPGMTTADTLVSQRKSGPMQGDRALNRVAAAPRPTKTASLVDRLLARVKQDLFTSKFDLKKVARAVTLIENRSANPAVDDAEDTLTAIFSVEATEPIPVEDLRTLVNAALNPAEVLENAEEEFPKLEKAYSSLYINQPGFEEYGSSGQQLLLSIFKIAKQGQKAVRNDLNFEIEAFRELAKFLKALKLPKLRPSAE